MSSLYSRRCRTYQFGDDSEEFAFILKLKIEREDRICEVPDIGIRGVLPNFESPSEITNNRGITCAEQVDHRLRQSGQRDVVLFGLTCRGSRSTRG